MAPTMKFPADWSKASANFLDATVSIAKSIIETDLYVKPADSHQYLLPTFCCPFYCKKGIPNSQALRLNRACSNNRFLGKKWNDLLKYLSERGYSDKMVRKEILRARAIPRDALLEKVNNQEKQNKITFHIAYHPVLQDVRKVLEELYVILASGNRHSRVFPMIGFKNNKNLKAHL